MSGIIVIKCGGSMLNALSDEFYAGIKMLQTNGYQPLIVHGGGPAINEMLEGLQIKSEFVNGLRKTTDEVMRVVEMVLSGSITNKLVRKLESNGISSIGINGCDGALLHAQAKDIKNLGYVGEITHINKEILINLLSIGMVPVISPIALGVDGADCYNINADTAAGAIAVAMQAEKLLFVTDVPGIMENGEMIEDTTNCEVLALIENETISGGMIPKVMAAIDSLNDGMSEVMIVSGKVNLLAGTNIIGTIIRKDEEAVI